MADRDRERTRERNFYEQIIAHQRDERERSFTGQVVIRGEELPWSCPAGRGETLHVAFAL